MSFGLEALFSERLEVFPHDRTSATQISNTTATSVIQGLICERDTLQAEVKEHTATIDKLQRRLYSETTDNDASNLPFEFVNRMSRLENDVHRLRKDNERLNDNLAAAENETCLLREKLVDKQEKVKGAKKKTKNAKEVATKEEANAKSAMGDKQRHVESERKMRKEKNEALAKLQEQRKINADLQAELAVEKSSVAHLRETKGTSSDQVTVAMSVELLIKRVDYNKMKKVLEQVRRETTEGTRILYEIWRMYDVNANGPLDDGDDEENEEVIDKLYGDMVEDDNFRTGAEHAGRRSMRALQAICRIQTQKYNARE